MLPDLPIPKQEESAKYQADQYGDKHAAKGGEGVPAVRTLPGVVSYIFFT